MKLVVSIVLLLIAISSGSARAQAGQQGATNEELAALVSQLSWDSVGGECQIFWHIFPDGAAAKRLVQIGKPATDELLNALEDETRGKDEFHV